MEMEVIWWSSFIHVAVAALGLALTELGPDRILPGSTLYYGEVQGLFIAPEGMAKPSQVFGVGFGSKGVGTELTRVWYKR